MSSIDSVIILIISLLTVRGIWTGFIQQISFIAALLLGLFVASRFYLHYSSLLSGFISTPQIAFLVTFLILFCAVRSGQRCISVLQRPW